MSRSKRNVISGNTSDGVDLLGVSSTDNVVAGNYIGVDKTGDAALSNGQGVTVEGGAASNWIGVNTVEGSENAYQRNVISGNLNTGVVVKDSQSQKNVIAGNLIGTNAEGTVGFANQYQYQGIWINGGASFNRIGTDGDGVNDAPSETSSPVTISTGSGSQGPVQPTTLSRETTLAPTFPANSSSATATLRLHQRRGPIEPHRHRRAKHR